MDNKDKKKSVANVEAVKKHGTHRSSATGIPKQPYEPAVRHDLAKKGRTAPHTPPPGVSIMKVRQCLLSQQVKVTGRSFETEAAL